MCPRGCLQTLLLWDTNVILLASAQCRPINAYLITKPDKRLRAHLGMLGLQIPLPKFMLCYVQYKKTVWPYEELARGLSRIIAVDLSRPNVAQDQADISSKHGKAPMRHMKKPLYMAHITSIFSLHFCRKLCPRHQYFPACLVPDVVGRCSQIQERGVEILFIKMGVSSLDH